MTNTGNVTLTGVTISDPTATVDGDPISLAPGAVDSTTFTATSTVTAADVSAGQTINTATVTGTPPSGSDENVSGTDDEIVTVVKAELALSKTAVVTQQTISLTNSVQASSTSDGSASATTTDVVVTGSTIVYTITVTNSGTGNAAGVVVIDTLPAGVSVSLNLDGATVLGNVVTWNLGLIDNGTSKTVSITVTTD